MISISHLSAGYPHKKVLTDLSLELPKGKITTLVGPNGCGKSTLLKVLTGILPVSSGTILLEGQELSSFSSTQRAQKLAYLPQVRSTADITVSRMVLHGRFPYLSYPRRYRREDYEHAEQVMKKLELLPFSDVPLSELSGGIRQKVYIAMALVQDSPVILMDEPTSFLDIEHQVQLMNMIRSLAQENGKTFLLVLHDLLLAMKYSDRVALLQNGVIACQESAELLLKSQVLQKIYGVGLGSTATENGTQYYYDLK